MLTDDEIIIDAIKKHPDCSYGEVRNGMNCAFQLTRVVLLWPDRRSADVGNHFKYEVEGYPSGGY